MSVIEHEGSRTERTETVNNIPEDKWTIDILVDLLLGLHDHGSEVWETAEFKLLKLACDQNIKPLTLYPKDLALLYIKPGTYEQTYQMVSQIKNHGLDAKEICINFFKSMDSNQKILTSLEILEGSELYELVKPIVNEIMEQRNSRRG